MIVERYPKSNEMIGNSNPDQEIFSLLDRKTSQMATCLLCSKNEKGKNESPITLEEYMEYTSN
jgi:hypothetical protein